MYLTQLQPDEKLAFFNLAYHLVSYHGIEPEEHALLTAAIGEMALRTLERPEQVDIPTECARFKSAHAKRIAAIELMMLALSDRTFQKEEQQMVNRILSAFGFGSKELDELLQWADRWFEVYNWADEYIHQKV